MAFVRWVVIVALVSAAQEASSAAQVISPGTSPVGGPYGGEARRPSGADPSMILMLDVGGGYDENLAGLESPDVPVQVFNPQQSGSLLFGTAVAQYRQGTDLRYWQSSGRGYMSNASAGAQRVAGGYGDLQFATTMGGRAGLSGAFSAAYDPTFLFNAFGPVTDTVEDGEIPGSQPTRGVAEERWLTWQGSLGVFRSWTPRQRTNARYSAQLRDPVSGAGFESRMQNVSVQHLWNFRERVGLQSSYYFNENRQRDELGREAPLSSHVGEVALAITRPLSPTRRLSLTLGLGMNSSRLELPEQAAQFTRPVYSAIGRFDLARDWSIALDYRRDISVLAGLSPEPFLMQVVSLRSLALVSTRLQLSFSASYSTGESEITDTGSFENGIATLQLLYALNRSCSVFTNYSLYAYRTNDVAALQPGFPERYDLNSVRVGVSFWLPVFGRFQG